jgi:hypothetical protein
MEPEWVNQVPVAADGQRTPEKVVIQKRFGEDDAISLLIVIEIGPKKRTPAFAES